MLPVSVCMIVKNEEKKLSRCLESVKPYGFEIVIVDTGSQDKTCEVASHFTDKIFHFAWCDDFSAARNYSLEMASNDWILMLDADEVIENLDLREGIRLQRIQGKNIRLTEQSAFTLERFFGMQEGFMSN